MPRALLSTVLSALLAMPAWAETYALDPQRTVPLFEIAHLWLFTERGRFTGVTGSLEYDPARRDGRLDVVIDARSLDTANDERDRVLKGPSWFDVDRYPSIRFQSARFVFEQDRLAAIEGTLTMHGITQPLRLEIVRLSCESAPSATDRGCSADARATLLRSRFGMRTGLPLIDDEVRLRIQTRTLPAD